MGHHPWKPCRCLPEVEDPKFRAHIATGGICIYSPGRTIEEAKANVEKHARKDRIPKKRWVDRWVEDITTGELV